MSSDTIAQRRIVTRAGFEDRARMSRLIEEVSGRFGEIARIVARDRSESPLFPLKAARIVLDEHNAGTEYAVQLTAEARTGGRSTTVRLNPQRISAISEDEPEARNSLRSVEDRSRTLRLVEEIAGRADEMAAIVSRVQPSLGRLSPVRSLRLSVTEDGPEAGRVDIQMEPILVVGDGVGCYADPPGLCCECPCP